MPKAEKQNDANRTKQSNAKRIIKRTGKLLFRTLAVLLILWNLLSGFFGETLLRYTSYGFVRISGISMEPELSYGDVVLVRRVPFEELLPGDTIVFRSEGETITHKILMVSGDTLVTKGTANEEADDPIEREDYLAKVIRVLPLVGALRAATETPLRLLIFTILVSILAFGNELFGGLYDWINKRYGKRKKLRETDEKTT